jgi:Tol biopolymer transport system component
MRTLQFSQLLVLVLAVSACAQTKEASAPKVYVTNLRQITSEGEKSGEGYFSPDGKLVVYQSVQEGCPHYQIYSRSLGGGSPKRLSPGQGLTTCAYFHPTSQTVLFASTHHDKASYVPPPKTGGRYVWDKHKSFEIYTVQRDGTGVKRLTNAPGYDAEGSYSSDGGSVCFTSNRDNDLEIYVMNADGSDQRRVTRSEGYDGGPFFSPDNKRICFRGFRDKRPGMSRYAQIYTIGVDGKGEKQHTFNTAVNWAPYYHPGGEYLAYCTNVGGHRNFEIILLRLSDSHIVRLTTDSSADVMPVFSPDGKKLMWTTTRYEGRSQLVLADFTMPPASAFVPPMKDDSKASEQPSGGQRNKKH